MPVPPIRKPYKGTRRLIVAMDIGTSFSAVSFCILEPGEVPKFHEIQAWPKQANPDAKVASELFYDNQRVVRAVGAETLEKNVEIQAEEDGWEKISWWKLHLRPPHLPQIDGLQLQSLPRGLRLEQIFSDFMFYLQQQLQRYISEKYGNGATIWESLFPTMTVILTTPNGWDAIQQHKMRCAAIEAGIVDFTGGRRVKFVTEAETAILYSIDSGCVGDWLVKGGMLIVCDYGGGTIDITAYKILNLNPLKLEEASVSHCYLGGAIFVNQKAKKYFRGSPWDNDKYIHYMLKNFEEDEKRKFNNTAQVSYVHLGVHESCKKYGIVRGNMRIPGDDMAAFFEPSITCIKQGIQAIFVDGGRSKDNVILVGGLAESPFVLSEIVKWGKSLGISVSKPDGRMSKAVANGALAWYIDESISSRIARYHYGTSVQVLYEPGNSEMIGRTKEKSKTGKYQVQGAWSSIVKKGEKIGTKKEFSAWFHREFFDGEDMDASLDLYAFRGSSPPAFISSPGPDKQLRPGFFKVCTVHGDLMDCYNGRPYLTTESGVKYKILNYRMCISLGNTEITVHLEWLENGKVKSSETIKEFE